MRCKNTIMSDFLAQSKLIAELSTRFGYFISEARLVFASINQGINPLLILSRISF